MEGGVNTFEAEEINHEEFEAQWRSKLFEELDQIVSDAPQATIKAEAFKQWETIFDIEETDHERSVVLTATLTEEAVQELNMIASIAAAEKEVSRAESATVQSKLLGGGYTFDHASKIDEFDAHLAQEQQTVVDNLEKPPVGTTETALRRRRKLLEDTVETEKARQTLEKKLRRLVRELGEARQKLEQVLSGQEEVPESQLVEKITQHLVKHPATVLKKERALTDIEVISQMSSREFNGFLFMTLLKRPGFYISLFIVIFAIAAILKKNKAPVYSGAPSVYGEVASLPRIPDGMIHYDRDTKTITIVGLVPEKELLAGMQLLMEKEGIMPGECTVVVIADTELDPEDIPPPLNAADLARFKTLKWCVRPFQENHEALLRELDAGPEDENLNGLIRLSFERWNDIQGTADRIIAQAKERTFESPQRQTEWIRMQIQPGEFADEEEEMEITIRVLKALDGVE